MDFVAVIDVLNAVFRLAEQAGLLEPLNCFGVRHRLSLYADDVVLIIRPSVSEVKAAMELLKVFGGGVWSPMQSEEELCVTN